MSVASSSAGGRPRRSVLYLPAANARAVAKAATLPCDGLVLDLEDSVAPDLKESAREAACAAVRGGGYGRREVVVRVNGRGTPWHDADLREVCAAGPDAVLVPKVDSPDVVRDLVADLEVAGAPEHTMVWAMIETPRAVLDVAAIAAAHPRLTVVVLGTNDLVEELGAVYVPGREPLVTALQQVLLGARAAGRGVLDGVYNDVRDLVGFEVECVQGRRFGFDGKTVVHPAQIDVANRVFAPSDDDVEQARGIVEAWESGTGTGVVTYRGRMVEALHVESARRVLAAHDAVSALEAGSDPD